MGLRISKEESIQKIKLRKEKVDSLWGAVAPGFNNIQSRVAVALDISGSMSSLFSNGTVQETLERLVPIALKFDDDGQMDAWAFNNSSHRLPSMSLDNAYNYIKDTGLHAGGGTSYENVIDDIVKYYTVENPANIPNFVIFITDGDTWDRDKARKSIINASNYPIFWQFVGIGRDNFAFLQELDNMSGRYVDNANFFRINNLADVNDNDLYKSLLYEYPTWLSDKRVAELLRK